MQHIVDRHALRLGDRIGGRFAEMLARLPPDLREKGALRGFLGPEVFVGLRAGEEVQALLGASGGDVEEAAGLDIVGFLVEFPYILVGRVLAGASFVDRGEEQSGGKERLPDEERLRAGARQAVEAGDDDGVELEALGAVDGHDLDRVLRRLYVGSGVEAAVDLVLERREVDLARLFKALELVEEDLGVLEVGLALHARRAAECEPRALDALAQRAAQPVLHQRREDRADAADALLAIGREVGDIAHLVEDERAAAGVLAAAFLAPPGREEQEIGEGEAAPGRAQAREPGDAVAEVQERARQRVEVLHHLLLAELLDVEGAEAHARLLEHRHDLVEVRTVADEDRLAARSLPDDSNELLRFLLAVVAAVPGHGGAGKRWLVRRSGKVRHGARCLVFLRGEHARERLVEPLHEAFLRAAVGTELDRLELHRPEPGVLGLQEERHFGFAEAVDRLHRVADEEQRAAVTLLPAGSQLGEELELRERGVLELVDQDVRDLLVEREQQVARVVDRAERLERAVSELGEVGLAALAEQHLELRDRGLEKREDRFQRLPLPVVVLRRRHVVERPERLAQARDADELGWRRGAFGPLALLRQDSASKRLRSLGIERLGVLQETRSFGDESRLEFCARRHGAGPAQPAVAALEHLGELLGGERDVVVEVREQPLSRGIELLEHARRGLLVEGLRVFDDLGLGTEAGEHRHLPRERGAERVDRLDAQAVGDLGRVRQALQHALAHLGRSLLGEGDGENFLGLFDDLQQFQEAAHQQLGLPGAGRRLDDEGALYVERGFPGGGVLHSSNSSSTRTLIFSYTRQSVSRPQ